IGMLMPRPRGNAENVALPPLEKLAGDDRMTAAFRNLIDDAPGMPMRLGFLTRPQKLHARADRLHDVATGNRIDVVHENAVERRALGRGRILSQRFVGWLPFVLEQRRIIL